MESFGKALKKARVSKRATLRELGVQIGKSIGYISDIEHDRKRPPKLDVVVKMEDFLDVKDGKLVELARRIRKIAKPNLSYSLKSNPKLSTVLLRADELPEEKKDLAMDKLIETLRKLEEEP